MYDEFVAQPLTITPARLRTKIVKLLASTDIKIGEFQRMLGVNANSYGKFMQTGTNSKYKDPWSATQNGTYHAAAFFFYKEDRLGKNALGKTRARASAANTPAKSSGGGNSGLLSPATDVKGGKPALPDVSSTQLESEHTWLTPSEVRKALQDLQLSFNTSVAGLARAAGVPYQSFNNFVNQGRRRVGRQGQPGLPPGGGARREGAHRARQAQVGQAQGPGGGGGGRRREPPHGRSQPRSRPGRQVLDSPRRALQEGRARPHVHRLLRTCLGRARGAQTRASRRARRTRAPPAQRQRRETPRPARDPRPRVSEWRETG